MANTPVKYKPKLSVAVAVVVRKSCRPVDMSTVCQLTQHQQAVPAAAPVDWCSPAWPDCIYTVCHCTGREPSTTTQPTHAFDMHLNNSWYGMVYYGLTSHSTQYRSFRRRGPWAVMCTAHSVMEGQRHNPLNPRCFCLQRPKRDGNSS